MAYVPSPETIARTEAELPGEVVRLFIARTTDYSNKIDDSSEELLAAIDRLTLRCLGSVRGALCHHYYKNPLINEYSTEVKMNCRPNDSDWLLLNTDKRVVRGLLISALNRRLNIEYHPIQLDVQCLGKWSTKHYVLDAAAMCQVTLTYIEKNKLMPPPFA
jgi:hypothetical protein